MSFVPESLALPVIVAILPSVVLLYNLKFFTGFWNKVLIPYVGSGTRFPWWMFALIVVCFEIDNWGTAIGFQGTSMPIEHYEGNPIMANAIKQTVTLGLAKTETAGMRGIDIVMMIELLGMQYFGWFTPFARVFIGFTALFKTYAGYSWWYEEGDFKIKDYLTFKNGRPTPERLDISLIVRKNQEAGYNVTPQGQWVKNQRRRLGATPIEDTNTLISNVFYWMFPLV